MRKEKREREVGKRIEKGRESRWDKKKERRLE